MWFYVYRNIWIMNRQEKNGNFGLKSDMFQTVLAIIHILVIVIDLSSGALM